jgi:hypothetical protein
MRATLMMLLGLCLFTVPANSQTLGFGEAVRQWASACQADVENHCSDIRVGSSNFSGCLSANASPACQQATAAFQANMQARFAAQAEVPKACKPDIARLCSNFQQGQARILRCLMKPERFKSVRSACKSTLEAAGWLDEVSIRQAQ